MVKWLEPLRYCSEGRWRIVSSNPGFAIQRLKVSFCSQSIKWVPFSNQDRIKQRKERDELCISYAVHRTRAQ